MDGEMIPSLAELPMLSPEIAKDVAIDTVSKKIYVEPRRATDPLILTFLRKCEIRGQKYQLFPVDLEEIRAYQQSGFRLKPSTENSQGSNGETGNLQAAIELLELAISYGANDIHIRRNGKLTAVEFRIKRSLRVAKFLTVEEGDSLERAFYSSLATSKSGTHMPLTFQDAELSGAEIEALGLSTVRMVRGYSAPYGPGGGICVLRLQPIPGVKRAVRPSAIQPLQYPRLPNRKVDFAARGYTKSQVEKLLYLAEGTDGIVVFGGPVNSGKTTTMVDLLTHTATISPDLRQVTIERPVEIPMPWAVQIPVVGNYSTAEEEGAAIAQHLKNILRMDVNIIGVNEIRIGEVARLVFEAGRTGHRCYTSIHFNDGFQLADRIESLDQVKLSRTTFLDPELIRGIVDQRLASILCERCSTPLRSAPEGYLTRRQFEVLKSFGEVDHVRVKGPGCSECNFDGTSRMTALAEIIITDDALMDDLRDRGSAVARRNYRGRPEADESILQSAMRLVMKGQVDVLEVNKFLKSIKPSSEVNG